MDDFDNILRPSHRAPFDVVIVCDLPNPVFGGGHFEGAIVFPGSRTRVQDHHHHRRGYHQMDRFGSCKEIGLCTRGWPCDQRSAAPGAGQAADTGRAVWRGRAGRSSVARRFPGGNIPGSVLSVV